MAINFRGATEILGLSRNNGAIADLSAGVKLTEQGADLSAHAMKEMPMLAFFEQNDFQGASEATFVNWKNVGTWWTDKVGSMVVLSGVWELFSEPDYRGERWILGPGQYPDVPFTIGSIRHRQKG